MNREGEGMRDEVLRAALSELEVPEHAAGFEDRLRARLDEEVAAREIDSGTDRIRHLPPRSPPLRRRSRRRITGWLPAVAAAMVAAIVVAITIGEPGVTPCIVSAAEVRGAVAKAWANADRVSGTLISRSLVGPDQTERERRSRFVITRDGDVRLTGVTRPGDIAYDADDNIERGLNPSEKRVRVSQMRKHMPIS